MFSEEIYKLYDLDNVIKKKVKIAIITIVRDTGSGERTKQKKIFIEIFNKILNPHCDFDIYIIEQSQDNKPFNIGKLKNIGFDIASKKHNYDNYIFTDIDMIPDPDLLNYYFMKKKYPMSLAVRGTRYYNDDLEVKSIYGNYIFVGGVLMFNKKIFKDINGYPNNFWGWGGEDTALLQRMYLNGIREIYYPKNGKVIDMELKNDKQIDLKTKKQIETENKNREQNMYEKAIYDVNTWKNNGLSNLNYKIIEKDKINKNISNIKVNLLYNEDKHNNPNLFNIFFVDLKQKMKQIAKFKFKIYKELKIKHI